MEKRNLSNNEKNIWLVDTIYNNTSVNTLAGSLVIKKDLNVEIAKKTINEFVRQNDALRMKIVLDKDTPMQYVKPYEKFDVEVIDLSSKTDNEIKEIKNKIVSKPIDIYGDSLFEYTILDRGEDAGEIFLKVHHIISDAWSISKMGTDLSIIYEGILDGTYESLEKPGYFEYLDEEQEYLSGEKYIKDKEFFKEYLKDFIEPVKLKENIKETIEAKRYSSKIDQDLLDEINKYCKENKVSVYNVFLAALYMYIYRITGKNDIVIGTPILNRSNAKLKEIQGMFVSTIPLRMNIEEDKTFLDICKNVASESFNIFRHSKYPYSKLIEEYRKDTGSNGEIYDVMFSYQNARASLANDDRYEITWEFSNYIQDAIEIHILDLNDTNTLTINIDYMTSLFEDIEIEYMLRRFITVVKDGIKNNKKVEDIEIMDEEEKHKILYEFNDTKTDYPRDKAVIDLFEEQVKNTPNNIALVFEDKTLTYQELNNKANQLANTLIKNGVKQRDRVAVELDKSFELMISILGILKIGASYVPIDNNYTLERKQYIVNDSNCKAVISIKETNYKIKTINISMVADCKNYNTILRNTTPENELCVLYTSGTTGEPKGVKILNRNVVKLVKNANYYTFTNKDSILQTSAAVFDVSLFDFFSALLNGGKLCLIKKENILNFEYLYKYVKANNVTIITMTSALFNQIIDNKIEIFDTLKAMITGGDIMSSKHADIFLKRYKGDKILFNSYGPTECASFCNMFEVNDISKITIGKPVSNTAGYILDNKNRLMPINIIGEYSVSGDGVSGGYINKEKITQEKFIENIFDGYYKGSKIYKTGDYAAFNFDGNVKFYGRVDNQVKVRGYRIELDEIKNKVLKYYNIIDAEIVITENSNNKSNKIILLYYVATETIEPKQLLKYLSKILPMYMVPSAALQIEKIPLNTNMKLDKTKLPAITIGNDMNEQLSYTEVKVKEIINEISHINLNANSNFFESGIDSLTAINIAINMTQKFEKYISVKDIFDYPSIRLISEHIENESERVKINFENSEQKITEAQKEMFYEYMREPNTKIYNVPFELKCPLNVDIKKLKSAIENTIKSNPQMNSSFDIINGVLTRKDNDIDYNIDIIKTTENDYKVIKEKFVLTYDLLKAPLYNIKIFSTEKNIHLLFDAHHIIFDGISFEIFMKKVSDIYNNKTSTDMYNKTDATYYNTDKNSQYFKEMFSRELPITNMPYDYKKINKAYFKGNKVYKNISKDLTNRINKFIIKNNITLSSLMQSAYILTLSKYMYSDDVIIGMVTSGRYNINEINSIGMYVKTLPYRKIIDWNKNIIDFVIENQKQILNEISCGDKYSIEEVLEASDIERTYSKNPLFNNIFVCQNLKTNEVLLGNDKAQITEVIRNLSKFEMTFEVMQIKDNICIDIEYFVELFKANSIKNFVKHYIQILEFMINNSSKPLYDIKMASEKEEKDIINKFNDNKTNFPKEKTVHQIFEENVLKYPNKIAAVFEESSITYEELNKRANKLAHYLMSKGIVEEDIIAIMIDKSIDYLISAIAVLKCNAAYTPIIEDLPNERAKYMIENANSKIIITNKKCYRDICSVDKIYMDDVNIYEKMSDDNLNLKNNSDGLLHVIYTSGSTGVPKGNMIKHKGMVRLLLNTNYVDYSDKDVMLASGSLTFDISGFEIWGAMMYGMTLHFITKEHIMNVEYYKKYINKNKITTTFLATPIFHMLVDSDVKMFDNMKSIYIGGEVLLPKYTNEFLKHNKNTKIFNAYGPAEITVICCSKLVKKRYNQDIPLGMVVSNNNCYILDKCNKICPINVPGELFVSGDGMGKGYINRPELTREKFIKIDEINDFVYKSGDLTKWNDKGEVRYIGRIDTQVKIRGQRIELSEIQSKIVEFNNIKEAVAIISEINNKKYIFAYYTAEKQINNVELKEYLEKYLPKYMIPFKFIELKNIPYNQNGKIDRTKLPKAKIDKEIKIVKPINSNQKLILNVYKKILEDDNIGMTTDFFDNGGDSLLVARLISEFKDIDIDITYADGFKYTTPMSMYNYIFFNKEEEKIIEDIKNIDYTQIDKLLKNSNTCNNFETLNNKQCNVVLIGSTGFLGTHILKELASNNFIKKIYCIVRAKGGESSEKRFKEKLMFYYKKSEVKSILEKCEIVELDITDDKIKKYKFNSKIDYVINASGYVKHYGDAIKFFDINVNGTKNIIEMCLINKSKLIHCSTISVSGNVIESGKTQNSVLKNDGIFTESNLYIGQDISNIYVYTKFIAEIEIYKAIINRGLKAEVLRIGNLTGRYSDAKFQNNVQDNAFANRIRSLINLRILPEAILDKYIEMTPVDYCAKAIVKLLKIKDDIVIMHLYNNKHLYLKQVQKILSKYNINLKTKSDEELKQILNVLLKDQNKINDIDGIIPDIDKNGYLKYNEGALIKNDFTNKVLLSLNFEWPEINEKYFISYIKYLIKIGFIDLEGKNE